MADAACLLTDGTLASLLSPAYWFNCMARFDSAIGIVIGALISVFAWLAKSIVTGIAVDLAARRRRADILLALGATVKESQDGYRQNYSLEREAMHLGRIDSGTDAAPFTITAPADFLLAKVKKEIEILPASIVADTTRYIYAVEYLDAATAAFMSRSFQRLEKDRKKGLVSFTFTIGREAAARGEVIDTKLARRGRLRLALRWLVFVIILAGAIAVARQAGAQTSGGTGLRQTGERRSRAAAVMAVSIAPGGARRFAASLSGLEYRRSDRLLKGSSHAAA